MPRVEGYGDCGLGRWKEIGSGLLSLLGLGKVSCGAGIKVIKSVS